MTYGLQEGIPVQCRACMSASGQTNHSLRVLITSGALGTGSECRPGCATKRGSQINPKHQYADLDLIVEDQTVSQKHVNLFQPAMFSTPDSPQPAELVINSISKDRIHGYVSSPKYRQSQLASGSNASTTTQAAESQPRQSLPQPQ